MELTKFSQFNPKSLYKKVDSITKLNNKRLEELLEKSKSKDFSLSWNNTAQLLDDWDEELFEKLFSVAAHLKSVRDDSQLRTAYNKSLPKISTYITEQKQNHSLYLLMKRLTKEEKLDSEQQKDIDNYLLECRLSGIDLPLIKRKKFAQLLTELARLNAKFSENLLDSNDKWKLHVKDKNILNGLPAQLITKLRVAAKEVKKDGWLVGLDMPIYQAIMSYADDESLRKTIHMAFISRASGSMKDFVKFDNTPVIRQILALRYKLSRILNYKNPAEMLMTKNMVKSPYQVHQFLLDIMKKSLPIARQEAKELIDYVLKHKKECHPWDLAYYSEKLKQERHKIDTEELHVYFPLPRVLSGMFELTEKLFGVKIEEQKKFDTWHKDVRLFVLSRAKEKIGYLYCDIYARDHKNGGAWMNDNRQRKRLTNGDIQLPVAYLVCNFRAPVKGKSLLLHQDVEVLFHEMGHCLHHLLTKVSCRGVAGINGVPHDMIELPSQIMENWCWDKKFIKKISEHYKTAKPLPAKILNNLIAAKNFQSALQMVRQIEFSLFDIKIHSKLEADKILKEPYLAQKVYDDLRYKYSPLPQIKDNRFPNTFSHIFAGGYAAGYYAYKWAEVMSADIYSLFEEKGIYNKQVANNLRKFIFESGGVDDALKNFIAVRGRKPDNAAFLRHNGITQATS